MGHCVSDVGRQSTHSLDWNIYFPFHQHQISVSENKHLTKSFSHKDLAFI